MYTRDAGSTTKHMAKVPIIMQRQALFTKETGSAIGRKGMVLSDGRKV